MLLPRPGKYILVCFSQDRVETWTISLWQISTEISYFAYASLDSLRFSRAIVLTNVYNEPFNCLEKEQFPYFIYWCTVFSFFCWAHKQHCLICWIHQCNLQTSRGESFSSDDCSVLLWLFNTFSFLPVISCNLSLKMNLPMKKSNNRHTRSFIFT